MIWTIGDVYRAKTGELLEVLAFTETECRFRMLDPKTLQGSDFLLEGPIENLKALETEMQLQKIDLETYVPTGLVKNEIRNE